MAHAHGEQDAAAGFSRRMSVKLRIGEKLMLTGAAIVLVPFIVMGVIVYVQAEKGINALIGGELVALTRSMSDYVENSLQGYVTTDLALAAMPEVASCVESYNAGTSAAKRSAAILSANLANLAKSTIYAERVNLVNIVGADGKAVASSSPDSIGSDVASRDYYQKAMLGETFISQMLISKVTGAATVVVATPIVGASGKPIGVCSVSLKTKPVTDELAKFVLGETGYFAVIDREGLFVLHPNKDVALKTNISKLAGLEDVARRGLEGEVGYGRCSLQGVKKVAAFSTVPSIGWVVYSIMPESEFLATAASIRDTIVLVAAAAGILALACLYFLSRSISLPLKRAVVFAEAVAAGDLTIIVRDDVLAKKDELGDLARALNTMSVNLKRIVSDIQSSAQSVAQGSEEISATAQTMSQGATEQAASAEEVSSSVEEMSATITQNSDSALSTDQIAAKAVKEAEEGSQAVSDAVSAMGEIAGKISIIEEIARQTNLLALNAAIEAARAGESGKGFAVVAQEVRKLAERSQNAAGEITGLSKATVDQAHKAGEIISGIVPDIRKTSELVREIAAASKEQGAGVEQIGTAMEQLDKVIQQNAGGSEELASMSEELAGQAQQLAASVAFFRLSSETRSEATVCAAPRAMTTDIVPAAGKEKDEEFENC